MEAITYLQAKFRLEKYMNKLANGTFKEIYNKNQSTYSSTIDKLLMDTKNDTLNFFNSIYQCTSQAALNNIYKNTDPKIICCFYSRYYLAVNFLEKEAHNGVSIGFINDLAFYRMSLFEIIEEAVIKKW